ncbi:MAG: rhodanese-like domain-containing protein [Candidatus Eisenbacteria bacterium]|uniref:Rhodanese-like domain-containing protein n=1 Tax=Eiseniibacteriota bacterium TaxID=2212470 RepID=A0A7Y2E898_UNCEI|nr:rhodanese-like domain-containing protein [Candidatus Eisenbacteria bacterium]
MKTRSLVAGIPAADSASALQHFQARLTFETDCWDVHYAMNHGDPDFVVLDVRAEEFYEAGHVPGAISLPHPKMTKTRMDEFPEDTLFVVYCAGPHCNGANRAAIKLARLGRPVKEMIGGVEGWKDEGFDLA